MTEEFDVPHRIGLVPDSNGTGGTAVFEIYIKTTPERLWEAITDPEMRAKYSFGVGTESEWTTGSEYKSAVPGVNNHAGPPKLTKTPRSGTHPPTSGVHP